MEKTKKFLFLMERELENNSSKGDWSKLHPLYLITELHYHASKLHKACEEKNKEKILEYSADCGNLSMMLADVTGSLNLLNGETVKLREGCDSSCPDFGYNCNINELFKMCPKKRQ